MPAKMLNMLFCAALFCSGPLCGRVCGAPQDHASSNLQGASKPVAQNVQADKPSDQDQTPMTSPPPPSALLKPGAPSEESSQQSNASAPPLSSISENDAKSASPDQMLEQAMVTYESAMDFWEEGDIDNAFAALDTSYGLLLAMPDQDDPNILQQQSDLRRAIARRIVEIYASQETSVGDTKAAIPRVQNAEVEAEIRQFHGPERSFFLNAYKRAGLYRPMILKALKEAGLPSQLSWLPLIESGFNPAAFSPARALGLWQFIRSTGYLYGLHDSQWVDERLDPEKATDAAIAYLKDLHNTFGDWLTALAGYNCGANNVLSAIKRQKINYLDQFWDLYHTLPQETRRYVPRFLATLQIVEDPSRYGMSLPEPLESHGCDRVNVSRSVPLDAIEKAAGLDARSIIDLNPELRRKITPFDSYELKIPLKTKELVENILPKLATSAVPEYYNVKVRRGDTPAKMAQRYGISLDEFIVLNGLSSASRLRPGYRVKIPIGAKLKEMESGSMQSAEAGSSKFIIYSVKRGDTLKKIAKLFGTTVEALKRDNKLHSNRVQFKQKLAIRKHD